MMSNKYWKLKDIKKLREECINQISLDQPPPRCIEKGKVNIKHFIYHNEKLKHDMQKLQQTIKKENIHKTESYVQLQNDLKSTSRKLQSRNLQMIELRKRINKLNEQISSDKKILNKSGKQNLNLEN